MRKQPNLQLNKKKISCNKILNHKVHKEFYVGIFHALFYYYFSIFLRRLVPVILSLMEILPLILVFSKNKCFYISVLRSMCLSIFQE